MEGNVHVSWKSDIDDSAVSTESLADDILVGLERDVTNEESVGLWVLLVTVGLGASVGAVLWCSVVAWGREVNVGLTSIDKSTLLGGQSLSGIGGVGELNVTETLGAAGVAVRDDTGAGDLTELLELAVQPLVINVPAQVTNEKVLGASVLNSVGLDLLGGGLLLIISLALLGWSSLLGLLSGFLLGIGRIGGIRARLGLLLGLSLGLGGVRVRVRSRLLYLS